MQEGFCATWSRVAEAWLRSTVLVHPTDWKEQDDGKGTRDTRERRWKWENRWERTSFVCPERVTWDQLRALGCPLRPLRARARANGISFVRSASQCNDRRRVVLSSPFFKGNETIFRRRPLFLSFSGHSGQSGHARSLTPSPADSQFRCQRDYEKRRIGYLRTSEYHFGMRTGSSINLQYFCPLSQRVQVDVST